MKLEKQPSENLTDLIHPKEKLIYQVPGGISKITCNGDVHFFNSPRGQRVQIGRCDCEFYG